MGWWPLSEWWPMVEGVHAVHSAGGITQHAPRAAPPSHACLRAGSSSATAATAPCRASSTGSVHSGSKKGRAWSMKNAGRCGTRAAGREGGLGA